MIPKLVRASVLMGLLLACAMNVAGKEKSGAELLRLLNKKRAGIAHFSCRIQNRGDHFGMVRFKRGKGLRVDCTDWKRTDFTVWITDSAFINLNRSLGLIQRPQRHKDMSIYLTSLFLPLLTPEQVAHVGELTEPVSFRKGTRALRLTIKTVTKERWDRGGASSIVVYYEMKTGRAVRIDLCYGGRTGYSQFIAKHQDLHGVPFPSTMAARHRGSVETFIHFTRLRDEKIADAVFIPDLKHTIVKEPALGYRSSREPADILAEALGKAKTDREKAGVYYNHASSRFSPNSSTPSTSFTEEMTKILTKAVELAPSVLAPRLLRAQLWRERDPRKWEKELEGLAAAFPQGRDMIYLMLLDDYADFERLSMGGHGRHVPDRIRQAKAWVSASPTSQRARAALINTLRNSGEPNRAVALLHREIAASNRIYGLRLRIELLKTFSSHRMPDDLDVHSDRAVAYVRNMLALNSKPKDASWYENPAPNPEKCFSAAGTITHYLKSAKRRKACIPAYLAKLNTAGDPISIYILARFASFDKDYEKEIRYLLRLRKTYPHVGTINSRLNTAYRNSGHQEKQIELAKELLARAQKHDCPREYATQLKTYVQLCKQYTKTDRIEAAAEEAMTHPEFGESLLSTVLTIYSEPNQKDKAIAACETALERNPSMRSAILPRLASHYESAGTPEKTLAMYQRILKGELDKTERFQLLGLSVRYAVRLKKMDLAKEMVAAMEKAATTDRDRQIVGYAKSKLGLGGKPPTPPKPPQISEAQKIRRKSHDLRMEGELLLAEGDHQGAVKLFKQSLSVFENGGAAHSLLRCRLQMKDHKGAVAVHAKYRGILRGRIHSPDRQQLIAAYKKLGKNDVLLLFAEDDYEDRPDYHRTLELAKAYMAAGKAKQAEKWYRKTVALWGGEQTDSATQGLSTQIANYYQKNGEPNKALAMLEFECLESAYSFHGVRDLIAYLERTDQLGQYLEKLEQRVTAAPKDVKLLNFACRFTSNKARSKGADYRQKLARAIPTEQHYTDWIMALRWADRHIPALQAHEEMLKRHPIRDYRDVAFYAGTLIRAGSHKKAESIVAAHLKKAPGFAARLHKDLAETYEEIRNDEAAAKHFMAALTTAKDTYLRQSLHQDLLSLYQHRGKPEKAKVLALQILESPKDERSFEYALYTLKNGLQKEKNGWEQFIAERKKTAAAKPGDLASQMCLVHLYAMGKDKNKTADQWRVVVNLDPSENNYRQLGQALSRCNDYRKLADMYREMIKRFPADRWQHQRNLERMLKRIE